MNQVLSEVPGYGRIIVCANCQEIHLVWQNITLNFSKKAFLDLAEMIRTAEKDPHFNGSQNGKGSEEDQAEGLFGWMKNQKQTGVLYN